MHKCYRGIFAVRPIEARAEEILILHVKEVLRVSDVLHVSSEDGVLTVQSFVHVEVLLK